jgi:hypothetical protein
LECLGKADAIILKMHDEAMSRPASDSKPQLQGNGRSDAR